MTVAAIPVLQVENLSIAYHDGQTEQRTVHELSFSIAAGEVLALVGESGSGKTTTAQSIIGLLADNGRVQAGSIRINGSDVAGWSQRQLQALRGKVVSLIPQDPTTSLNPVRTVGDQVGEMLRLHGWRDKQQIALRVLELLQKVGLSQPELRARQYPHELSGGMKQRVLIAIAIALQPALIIADEPTSALDVTVQRRILDLIDDLRREFGTAVLLVTHDLGVAADRANRLVVLQAGRIQEQGPTADVLRNPQSRYTRQLLADAPSLGRPPVRALRAPAAEPAIVVRDLVHEFAVAGSPQPFRAVDGISFEVPRGSTHAIVGESGSGKTTTIRDVVGFGKPTSGRITVEGIDVTALRGEALRQFRKTVQLVYQNPFSSLDPRQSIYAIIEEPLLNFERLAPAERERRVHDMLARVGLPPAVLARRPRALSGGQRQRVAIARALILQPRVLVLDEAVSALDVTVQAQILALLDQLQRELQLTYLFISHDLAVVRQIADTVSVLQGGRQVDAGPVDEVFSRPGSAYTRELIAAIPGKNSSMHKSPSPNSPPRKRLGFFSRLLDQASAAERYRLVTAQIQHAEAHGFDTAWVAQHHFHEAEGGLPAPLVFLSQVAARTQRIRLGTGIITLPMENPIRVAEDAAVLDLLSGGRLELGLGTGGTPESFTAFGLRSDDRARIYAQHLAVLRNAWAGLPLPGGDRLYPAAPQLLARIWQATFSAAGAERAGLAGDGLMLSRTQPRSAEAPAASLADIQNPLIETYLAALPAGTAPRILGSRTLFVAEDRQRALQLAEVGLRRSLARAAAANPSGPASQWGPDAPLAQLLAAYDVHVGTPDEVIASLRADTALARATDISFQVHSIDPPHADILRSIALTAQYVAPALGWRREDALAPPATASFPLPVPALA